MSNTMRWRYGDTNPVMAPALEAADIEIGDLVYQTSGVVRPASLLADLGSEGANQEAFHDAFLGVAMQASPAGSSDSIRVATTGVFEFDCLSTTAELGDLFGPDEDGGGTELMDQTVVKVASPNIAVGRCAKRLSPAGTRALVEICSTIMRGGPQLLV